MTRPDADAVEAARRIKPVKTPEQTAAAILRAYEKAQGKHPRSHTMADYNRLAHRLAPIVARALLSIREEMEWRPIETAPKDGTRIILSWGGYSVVGFYLDNSAARYMPWQGWRVPSMEPLPRGAPTHWQPLPSPLSLEIGS